ncbi:Development/cell death domain, partial [Dillenia turbinata]
MPEEGEAPMSNLVLEDNSTADNAVTEVSAQVPSQMHSETALKETAGADPVDINAENPVIGSKDVKEGNAEKLSDNKEVNAEGNELGEEEESGEGEELDEEEESGEGEELDEEAGGEEEELNEEVSGEEASEKSEDVGGEQNTEAEASHRNGRREDSEKKVSKKTKESRKRTVADKDDADKPGSSKKQKSSKKAKRMGTIHKGDTDTPRSSKKKKSSKKAKSMGTIHKHDADTPRSSKKRKSSKKVKSMGMIFMCSSKTKDDCYHYKVLGLPASKKEMVLTVYKGMRLFLFDTDHRLMHGIYRAAGPGGYNLEPKAFKSAFPSQVRFTIFEDCLPLAEEKFKKVIKDNYYTRNKFDCQLTAEQVKNLCKLFQSSGRVTKSKPIGASRRRSERETRGSFRQELDEVRPTSRSEREMRGSFRQELNEVRPAYVIGNPLYSRVSDIYGREVLPPRIVPPPVVPLSQRVAPGISPRSYIHERTLDIGIPRSTHIERRDPQILYLDWRHPNEIQHGDPYVSYREQQPLYRDPVYAASLPSESESARVEQRPLYRDPVYAASLPSESESARVEQHTLYRDPFYAASLPSESESTRGPPLEYPPARSQY